MNVNSQKSGQKRLEKIFFNAQKNIIQAQGLQNNSSNSPIQDIGIGRDPILLVLKKSDLSKFTSDLRKKMLKYIENPQKRGSITFKNSEIKNILKELNKNDINRNEIKKAGIPLKAMSAFFGGAGAIGGAVLGGISNPALAVVLFFAGIISFGVGMYGLSGID